MDIDMKNREVKAEDNCMNKEYIKSLENFINNYEKEMYEEENVCSENVEFINGFKACLGRIELANEGHKEYLMK